LEKVGLRILSYYRDGLRAKDLPCKVTGCSAFNGCPYLDKPCDLTLAERIEAMETQAQVKNMTMAEKIRNRLGRATATSENTSASAGTTASAPAADPIASTAVDQPEATKQGQTPVSAEGGDKLSLPGLSKQGIASKLAASSANAAAVNPPEKGKGVDPDAPVTAQVADSGTTRAEAAVTAMTAVVRSHLYSIEDNRYEVKVAQMSVRLADALFTALKK
jgi:hypothetical protein